MHRSILGVVLLALLFSSCGSDRKTPLEPPDPPPSTPPAPPAPPAPPGTPGLSIVSGSGASDTVITRLAAPLVIELRDNAGQPLAGHIVHFAAVAPEYGSVPWVWLSRVGVTAFGPFTVVDTTNAAGQASTRVQLGARAGTARLLIRVPALDLSDTASYVVMPGRAAKVAVLPRDTTLYTGNSYELSALVWDKHDNVRDDTVSYAVVGTGVALSGAIASPLEVGRHRVLASVGTAMDTAFFTAPPVGRLAVAVHNGVVLVNTDGSDRSTLATLDPPLTMQWAPDGGSIVMDGTVESLRRLQLNGTSTPLGPGYYPHLTANGGRIFFTRLGAGWKLMVMDADGGNEAVVVVDQTHDFVAPAPSPLSDRLVMVEARGGWEDVLWQLDVATGTATSLNIGGHSPRWSPTGEQVAFVGAPWRQIHVMDATFGNLRTLTSGEHYYNLGLTWSGDGKWIAAYNETTRRINLVNAQTAMVLPLHFSEGMEAPAWKP